MYKMLYNKGYPRVASYVNDKRYGLICCIFGHFQLINEY